MHYWALTREIKTYEQTKTCTQMYSFICNSQKLEMAQKSFTRLNYDTQIHTHTIKFYLLTKRKELLIYAATWINLQRITLSNKANLKSFLWFHLCNIFEKTKFWWCGKQLSEEEGNARRMCVTVNGNERDRSGFGAVLYPDRDGRHMNLHVIKLCRTKHTYIHTHTHKYK